MSVVFLERLLGEWDRTHDARIEEAIVRVGRAIARPRGLLRLDGDEGPWHALAAAGDAGDIDRLLDVPWRTTPARVQRRVAALAARPPDPRIARRLVACARHFRHKSELAVHEAIAPVLARAPTSSILPHLDALSAGRTFSFTPLYDKVRAAIAATAATAPSPELVAEAAVHADGHDIASLWAEHAAAPADAERRVVLADALDVANDPRGELIQLQLAISAGTADRKARSRAERLLSIHADTWVGALPLVEMSSVRFERGFPVAIETRAGMALDATLDRPEWSTVEELTLVEDCWSLGAVIARMPLLRRLGVRSTVSLQDLVGPFPRIEAVACQTSWEPSRTVFPNLRVAGGRWGRSQLASIHRLATSLGLEAIVHHGIPVDALREAVAMRSTGPREMRFAWHGVRGFLATGWRVRIRRGSNVADLALDAPAARSPDLELVPFQLADAGIRQIRVHIHPDVGHGAAEAARSALARLSRNRGVVVTTDGKPIDLGAPPVV